MNEWKVFLVLGEIIGLFLLVGKPILTLNATMSVLANTLNALKADYDKQKEAFSAEHKDFNEHLGDHDTKLENHEVRISLLEKK